MRLRVNSWIVVCFFRRLPGCEKRNESKSGAISDLQVGEENEEETTRRKKRKDKKPFCGCRRQWLEPAHVCETHSRSRRRRRFLSPSAGAQSSSATPVASPSPSPSPAPLRVTKEMLRGAEQLFGIELTDSQKQMALQNANSNLERYETLRKMNVPLDTEPATSFHPALPGKRFNVKAVTFKLGKIERLNFKTVEDLAFATVPQLADLMRNRKISSLDLTKMYLARLKRYGPKLNCTVTLTEELALVQSAEADREIKQGKYRGPLHGIPWGAKDLFATKGIRTTWGAEPYREQVIDYDATMVSRLQNAGAVLVAKLSMGALAQGGRWFGGMTRNPWQVEEERTGSSGSSAGPASATAAGLVGFSIGTETLGSIVSPSSRCGVVGYGRLTVVLVVLAPWDSVGRWTRSALSAAALRIAPQHCMPPMDQMKKISQ